MRVVVAFLCFCSVAAPATADEVLGRVRALYYEAGRGVLVEAKMLHRSSAIRWADVEVSSRRILVQLPADMNAAPGDLVAVRLGDPKSTQLAQILPTVAINRAVETPGAASVGR
jgi:hypothetical protein